MKTQVLYHKQDGAVELRSAYVDDALAFPEEWSRKPWPGQEDAAPAAPAEAPAENEPPARVRKPRFSGINEG